MHKRPISITDKHMNTYFIPQTDLQVSRIGFGCMNLGGLWNDALVSSEIRERAFTAIHTAIEYGFNFFDHADIYTLGKSELVFGDFLQQHPGLRERIVLQSKCGIRFAGQPYASDPQRYDFSYDHIIQSVEGSLNRLKTDYLDLLLLHRPDPLVEPEEVARAFEKLYTDGKVRHFGVSNHTSGQIALLKNHITQPLVVNQVQLGLAHPHLIAEGVWFNRNDGVYSLTSNTLDYCRLHQLQVQAWAPLAGGRLLDTTGQADPAAKLTAALIWEMAEHHQTTPEAVALAWLLCHPAKILPIIGTLNPKRIRAVAAADLVKLSREAWYRLFIVSQGMPLP